MNLKYLKGFNESVDYKKRLEEFCKENLAYLLDNQYLLNVYQGHIRDLGTNFKIVVTKINERPFLWDNIKDDYIQFLELVIHKGLCNLYDDVTFINYNTVRNEVSINSVINELNDIEGEHFRNLLYSVSITIKNINI